jgi:hypothetical protein
VLNELTDETGGSVDTAADGSNPSISEISRKVMGCIDSTCF